MTFWGKNVAEYVAETVARKGSSSSPTSVYERLFASIVPAVIVNDVIHPADPKLDSLEIEVVVAVKVFERDGHDVQVIGICIVSLQTERLIHLCTRRNIDVKLFTVLLLELATEFFDELYILRNRIEFEPFDSCSRVKIFDGPAVAEFYDYNIFFFSY